MAAISPMAGMLDAGQAAQQDAEQQVGGNDEAQRLPGHLPILSPSSVSTTIALNDDGAQDGQEDAQQQREVARPHAGPVADRVVGGAPGKGATDHP